MSDKRKQKHQRQREGKVKECLFFYVSLISCFVSYIETKKYTEK